MLVIGIDPGVSGAIACGSPPASVPPPTFPAGARAASGHPLGEVVDMPVLRTMSGKRQKNLVDLQGLKEILEKWIRKKGPAWEMHCFLEEAQAMPGQGIVSTGSYMRGFGAIEGLLAGLGIPYTLVRPQVWKKVMMAGMDKEKEASIVRAKQLWPSIALDRKKDHGRADALLIMEYGRRQLGA